MRSPTSRAGQGAIVIADSNEYAACPVCLLSVLARGVNFRRLVLQIKRAYEPASKDDGYRVLIDRLWPRGIAKARFVLDQWAKELAPSTELRKSFGHDPSRWREFRARYRLELRRPEARATLEELARRARRSTVTLLYSARDEEHNNAVVLKEILEGSARKKAA